MSSDRDVIQSAYEDQLKMMYAVFVDALVVGEGPATEQVALTRFRRGLAAAQRARTLLQGELHPPVA